MQTAIALIIIVLVVPAAIRAEDRPFERGSRTRGLVGGWGIGYRPSGRRPAATLFVYYSPTPT